jgi:hypothetical protein
MRPWLAIAADKYSRMILATKISAGPDPEYPDLGEYDGEIEIDCARLEVRAQLLGSQSYDPEQPYRWRKQFDA